MRDLPQKKTLNIALYATDLNAKIPIMRVMREITQNAENAGPLRFKTQRSDERNRLNSFLRLLIADEIQISAVLIDSYILR